jgi:uncharacterized protein YgbK (DUF1537 family)
MANHPATPMRESDLRLHLGAQTPLPVAGLDLLELHRDGGAAGWRELKASGAGVVVLDALEEGDLRAGARLMLDATAGGTAFALGSGGLSRGIAGALTGREARPDEERYPPVERALVVAGSRSALTARQIRHAVEHGWVEIALDLPALADGGARREREVARVTAAAVRALGSAAGAIVHSSPGSPSQGPVPAVGDLGSALGRVVVACRSEGLIDRAVVAGGDTSGYVTRALGVEALEAVGPLGGEALLCRVASGDVAVVGLEVVLKGGQIGDEDLFETARTGGLVAR